MQIVIRKPSLGVIVGGILVFLLFAGRWGLNVESQSLSLSALSNIFYQFAFELRWWLLATLGLLVAFDYFLRRTSRLSLITRHRGLTVFLALAGVLLTGAAFTDGSDATVIKVFEVAALVFTALIVFYCQNQCPGSDVRMQEATLWFCFLLGTAISILAILTADLTQRASVADGGPNTFVRIVGVAAIACIGLKRIPQVIAFGATAGYLALIVLTQSRGGMFAFLCAIGLQFVWAFGWRSKLVFGGVALASTGLVANFTSTGQRCVEIIQDRVFTQTFVQNYTAGRDEIYSDSWAIWQESFFLGDGLNNWADRLGTYPHNIELEIGCDSGLIGVTLFLILIGIYVNSARLCKTATSKSIACITLFYFLAAQFSGDLYDSRGLFYFGTMLCSAPLAKRLVPTIQALTPGTLQHTRTIRRKQLTAQPA